MMTRKMKIKALQHLRIKNVLKVVRGKNLMYSKDASLFFHICFQNNDFFLGDNVVSS